jgi:hypothetical protein
VSFVFLDDVRLNYYGGHGFVVVVTTAGNSRELRDTRLARVEVGVGRRHRSNPADAGPVMVGTRNRRASTDARRQSPETHTPAQAKFFWKDLF